MAKKKRTYAIRRADGQPWEGDYTFFQCGGPDDWSVAEEFDYSVRTKVEIVEMVVVAKRTFG